MSRSQDPGVPLTHYIEDHRGRVVVQFNCMACMAHHDVEIARVVERLKASGRGDENTGIRAIGLMSNEPCKRCGGRQWETRPWFT